MNMCNAVVQTLNRGPGPQMQQAMQNKISGLNMLQNQQINMQNNPMMSQMNQISQENMGQQIVPQQHMTGPQMGPNQMQQTMQVIS